METITRKNRRENAGLNWSQVAKATGLNAVTVKRAEDPIEGQKLRKSTTDKLDPFYQKIWKESRKEEDPQLEIDLSVDEPTNPSKNGDALKNKFPVDYVGTTDPDVEDLMRKHSREQLAREEEEREFWKACFLEIKTGTPEMIANIADDCLEQFKKRFRS